MPERAPRRIGVDARELLGAPTGVGRYLGEFFGGGRHARRRWPALRALRAGQRAETLARRLHDCPAGTFEVRAVAGTGERGGNSAVARCRRPRLTRDLLRTAYTAPVRLRVPLAVAIHDVSYMAHPEWFPWRTGLRRRWLTRLSARRAVRIFTCSEFSRQEIAAHTGVPLARVEVTRYGFGQPSQAPRAGGVSATLWCCSPVDLQIAATFRISCGRSPKVADRHPTCAWWSPARTEHSRVRT